ncbi:MAG: DVU0298 family protein [Nitrospirota bacterium]
MKKRIRQALEANDLAVVVEMAAQDKRVVPQLVRISYDKETLAGWRAILAVGLIAQRFVGSEPEFLRETCRKLLWSLTDESGGIGWSAPEILGEIVSADPKRFADLIPLIASVYEIEEDIFRPGVLYALGRIAKKNPELVALHQKIIILSLTDKNPLVRVRGLELLNMLRAWVTSNHTWSTEYSERIANAVSLLSMDQGEAWIYRGDGFHSVLVSDEAIKYAIKIVA